MEAYELRFHGESECWRVYSGTGLLYSLHCGDAMLFQVGEYFLPSNLELDTEWYVKFGEARFWLHRQATYRVKPIF
ncbi:DUF5348 domain-containing protein [Paenibacillus koleovorans]|uniref:DUF5348 domain-containing protein n=1 Tax=Paenibacillus koleovorans TaxID=121608 RepID=UPI000FDC4331|nr:DUF5348 domain-containing protein [Paenibacillus koleovorans]